MVLLSQNCNNLSLLVAFVSGVIINPYQSEEGRKLKGLKGLKLRKNCTLVTSRKKKKDYMKD